MHGEAFDLSRGQQHGDAPLHVLGCATGFLGALQAEPDTAHVRFVRDIVGQDLDHTGAVLDDPALGQGRHCRRIARDLGGHRRDAVCREQLLCLHLRKYAASGGDHRLQDGTCGLTISAQVLGQRRWRAHQRLLGPRVAREVGEAVNGFRRSGEAGDALGGE